MENELENFSAAYMPFWTARGCVVVLESFCMRCRLLPEISAPASIPAALADRLEDTKVADEIAIPPLSTYTPAATRWSYELLAGNHPVSRPAADPRRARR